MPTWKEAQQPTQTFKGKSSKPNLFYMLRIWHARANCHKLGNCKSSKKEILTCFISC